jgi:hypothetical protein
MSESAIMSVMVALSGLYTERFSHDEELMAAPSSERVTWAYLVSVITDEEFDALWKFTTAREANA